MKKLLLCMIAALLSMYAVSGADIPESFRRGFDEPASIFPDRIKEFMLRGSLDEYWYECLDRIRAFLAPYETGYTEQGERLTGTWILTDADGQLVSDDALTAVHRCWGAGSEFVIMPYEGNIRYERGTSDSLLYYDSGHYYLLCMRYYGAFKQIKIVDGALYFYVLDGDEWFLDPIHESGRYYYKRYPPPDDSAMVPLRFPRTPHEPVQVFPDRLREWTIFDLSFWEKYGSECIDRISTFLAPYETSYTEQGERFIGTWKLVDADDRLVSDDEITAMHRYWISGSKFEIVQYKGLMLYWQAPDSLVLHYDSKHCYIWYGVLKQIRIVNGYLYVYVLDEDEWILDTVHEGGRYRYKWYPPPEDFWIP